MKTGIGLLLLILLVLSGCSGNPREKKERYFERGQKFLLQGKYRKAEVEFRRALQVDPGFARAYYALGEVYRREGRIQAAYGAYLRAVELKPDLLPARLALGGIYLLVAQGEKALKEAEYVLQKNPQHSGAKLLKAGALLSLGKYPEAQGLLEPLCEEKNVSACVMLGELFLKENKPEKAERYLRAALSLQTAHPQATLLLARLLETQHQYSEAEKLYFSLVKAYPQNFKYLELLVAFYQRRGSYSQAVKVLRERLKEGGADERAYLLLARIYMQLREEGKAEEALREGLKRFPQSIALLERLGLYYFEKGRRAEAYRLIQEYLRQVNKGSLAVKARLFQASLLTREGKYEEALAQLEEVLKESPHSIKAHLFKGDILLRKGDYEGAIAEYRAALGEDPKNVAIMLRLARAHLLNGELDLAGDLYQRVRDLDPKNREAYLGLSEVYWRKGRHQEARALLEKKWKESPGDLVLVERLVDFYLRDKDLKAARKLLKETLALGPRHPLILTALASIVRKAGLTREMINYCEKLAAKSPHPFYFLLLGQLYGEIGDYSRAIALYQQVLEKDPQNVVAANNLAFYLAEYKPTPENLSRAESLILPWVKKYPSRPELVDTLAWIKYRKGNYAEARSLLEKLGDKVIKRYPEIAYHLGVIYYRLGEKSRAAFYLRVALTEDRDFWGRKEAERLLRELENRL